MKKLCRFCRVKSDCYMKVFSSSLNCILDQQLNIASFYYFSAGATGVQGVVYPFLGQSYVGG